MRPRYAELIPFPWISNPPSIRHVDPTPSVPPGTQVLRSVVASGHLLPTQVALELHYRTHMPLLPWRRRSRSSGEIALFMEFLHNYGGYFLVDRHDNPRCGHCSEILVSRLPCPAC